MRRPTGTGAFSTGPSPTVAYLAIVYLVGVLLALGGTPSAMSLHPETTAAATVPTPL
ncbi:MAG: hypothetical protein ACK4QW_19630 [Alphaproteobacteria bacterium]